MISNTGPTTNNVRVTKSHVSRKEFLYIGAYQDSCIRYGGRGRTPLKHYVLNTATDKLALMDQYSDSMC